MTNNKKLLMVLILILNCNSYAEEKGNSFYGDRERGWYWFEQQQKEAEEKQESTKVESGKQRLSKLQEEVEELKAKAVLDPTESNVHKFYVMQKKLLDMSGEFGKTAKLIGIKYPELLEGGYPSNSIASNVYHKEQKSAQESSVTRFAEEFGLIIFVIDGCPYCEKLLPVIEEVKRKHNFAISFASFKDMKIGDIEVHKNLGLMKKLNIKSFPSVFAYSPAKSKIVPISNGLVSLAKLEQNIAFIENYISQKKKDLKNKIGVR